MFESDYGYEERKKERIKWAIVILVSIVFLVVVTKMLDSCSHRLAEDIMEEKKVERITKLSMNNDSEAQEVLIGIAIKNGDWSLYPLSKEFLKKYNSKDGIFPKYSFEEVSGHILNEEKYSERYEKVLKNNNENILSGIFVYTLGNGLFKRWENTVREIDIAYYTNGKGEINDFIIIEDKMTVDEYGDTVRDYDKEFTYHNLEIIAHILFFDHNWKWYSQALDPIDIKKEPCSKKLVEKVLNKNLIKTNGLSQHSEYVYGGNMYIDFFPDIKYSFGRFYYDKGVGIEESVMNKCLYAVCQVYNDDADPIYSDDLPEKNYIFKVQFELDNENKLDDIWVEYIGEISNEELAERYD